MVCCLFCRNTSRNALRASQAVLITDVMVNVKNISLDKKAFKKNNTATTNFDGPELCIEFKPSSDFNNVKINRAPDGAMAKLFSCNHINWGENRGSRSYVKCFSDRKIMAISNEITGYFGEEPGLPVPEKCALIALPQEK